MYRSLKTKHKKKITKKAGIIDFVKDLKNKSTLHNQYPVAIVKIKDDFSVIQLSNPLNFHLCQLVHTGFKAIVLGFFLA